MRDINILKANNVDLNRSLEIFDNMNSYEETLIDFLNSISEKLNELLKSKENSDMNNYAIYAHSIKSDAKYLGFTSLANIAYDHEMKSKEGNQEYININFIRLEDEFNHIIKVIDNYLKG